ncbi:MAG: DMT family protein [Hyphomicrobiaceae bacterium]
MVNNPFGTGIWAYVSPVVLLVCFNLFMTFAWYGHLKFKESPLLVAIAASWGIALVEYCFAVPANRFGSSVYSAAELKTIQEVVTLTVFAIFSVSYLQEALTWRHAAGFAFIVIGAGIIFSGKA